MHAPARCDVTAPVLTQPVPVGLCPPAEHLQEVCRLLMHLVDRVLEASALHPVGDVWFSGGTEVITVSEDEIRRRPERVIILDADDPMTEIEGRVVWQEEHDRVVEATRRAAFEDGYAAALRDAARASEPAPVQIRLRRRRSLLSRLKLAFFLVGLFAFLLALPVIVFGG
jgi:hypothetical protein